MKTQRLRRLNSVTEAVDALGGNMPTAKLTSTPDLVRVTNHITNWKATNRFPADTFLVITTELSRLGFTASPSLWGITEPKRQPARAAG